MSTNMADKGSEYLDKALQAAEQGKNLDRLSMKISDDTFAPFKEDTMTTKMRRGVWIAFVVCSVLAPSLVKLSVHAFPAPFILAAFHLLAGAMAAPLGARVGILPQPVELSIPASLTKHVPALLPSACLVGLRFTALIGLLLHLSVAAALCSLSLGMVASHVAAGFISGKAPGKKQAVLSLVSLGLLFIEISVEEMGLDHFSFSAFLYCDLWVVSSLAIALWDRLKLESVIVTEESLFGRLKLSTKVQELAKAGWSAERELSASTALIMKSLLPVIPLVILGLIIEEGKDLSGVKPSALAIMGIILSCFTVATIRSSSRFAWETGPKRVEMLLIISVGALFFDMMCLRGGETLLETILACGVLGASAASIFVDGGVGVERLW